MIIENKSTRDAKVQSDARERLLDLMIPHQKAAWLPVRLHSGQRAWLQKVWRIGYDFDLAKMTCRHESFATEKEALDHSLSVNLYRLAKNSPLSPPATKRLWGKVS